MMSSLRTRLFIGVAAFILMAGMAAGYVTFRWAFDEAIELQDAVLLQVGALAAENRPQTELPTPRGIDAEARVVVAELRGPHGAHTTAHSTLPLPPGLADGLWTIGHGRGQWRVLVRSRADGSRVAVGQLTAYRDEIARGSALRTVVPFAVLVPCLLLLVAIVIRVSFRPVARLAVKLDASHTAHLTELPTDGMPEELRPFIESINRLLRRIAMMMRQQRRFVADAAHELRSPITALSVQTENLDRPELPPETRRRLAALQTGIRRTAHLLEQLLALARYESSGAPESQAARLDQVAREVIADLLPAAQARMIDLGFERIEGVVVRADETALAVLTRNLVDNAIRHSPDGGRVDVHLYAEGARAILRVEDSGPGISETELTRVFEPFYRGLRSQGEGTGLGLSIVDRIARGISASVELENIPPPRGPGLRVAVTFELATAPAGAPARSSPPTAARAARRSAQEQGVRAQ